VSAHPVQWVTPSPLWPSALDGDPASAGPRMRAPALLRFERDSFMDDVAATLARDPAALAGNVATKVTYRLPAPGDAAPPPPTDLKLFQAAHGHFHLVAASLTCRLPGLPDRDVDSAADERVRFVLRRVDDVGAEWAWSADPAAPDGRTWSPATAQALNPDEDELPLFGLRYQDADRQRRVYVGLVPTSSGETFKAAGLLPAPGSGAGAPPADPRPAALKTKVTDPLRALAAAPIDAPADVTDPGRRAAIVATELAQLVEASRFLLVDFAEFLVANLPDVWSGAPRNAQAALLHTALATRRADPGATTTWQAALHAAWETRRVLYGDERGTLPAPLNLKGSPLTADQLDALVGPALGAPPPAAAATSIQGDAAPPPHVPKLDPRIRQQYVIRCVYRRPRCAPLHPDVISEPSERFQIAGFFDLDAPTRPIHITLPIDTGIADLRKLRKNVNFVISNQLRAQMNRVANLNDALKGQFADGGSFDFGLVCSFSIPIITICALLVLMIFIQLLNIVFWWMPFLRICFPIGPKGANP
jgi:hypothetical protein